MGTSEPKPRTELDELLLRAAELLERVPDAELKDSLSSDAVNKLLKALGPQSLNDGLTPYPFLLANRNRLHFLAMIRHAIQQNYSYPGTVNGVTYYISPMIHQWYPEGVMFVQGKGRFEGNIGLFKDGEIHFAISARDCPRDGSLSPDDVKFLTLEEYISLPRNPSVPSGFEVMDAVTLELEGMLGSKIEDEAKYQEFLERNPWVLGAQYNRVQRHSQFDDTQIPDFTAVRVRDGCRDIIELKSPFLELFKQDGSFRSEFNSAWDQAERYLDFARTQQHYLSSQKRLRFENPHCYLILGEDLTEEQRANFQRKMRINPAIIIITYRDLLAIARSTVEALKTLAGLEPT